MHFHKITLTLFFVCFLSNVGHTQDLKLQVGQSVDNETTKNKAATIIATFPRDSVANSESIQGFIEIGINFPNNIVKSYAVSAFAEKHSNTLVSKKQDVTQFGGQIMFYLWEKSQFPLKNYKIKLRGTAKYSHDRIMNTEEGQYLLHLNLTPKGGGGNFWDALLNNENVFPRNDYENYEGSLSDNQNPDTSLRYVSDFIQFSNSHTVGIEYLSNNELLLGNLAYSINMYLFSGALYRVFEQYRMLQLSFGIDHRYSINSQDTELFIGNLVTASAGFNFLINENKGYQLGVRYFYQDGGHPLHGLPKQTFSQLALSAKFVLDN